MLSINELNFNLRGTLKKVQFGWLKIKENLYQSAYFDDAIS